LYTCLFSYSKRIKREREEAIKKKRDAEVKRLIQKMTGKVPYVNSTTSASIEYELSEEQEEYIKGITDWLTLRASSHLEPHNIFRNAEDRNIYFVADLWLTVDCNKLALINTNGRYTKEDRKYLNSLKEFYTSYVQVKQQAV